MIKPRAEEILEQAMTALHKVGFSSIPGQSVVMTGGCSLLPGMEDLSHAVLGKHVRLGRPMLLSGLPESMSIPQFSSAVGMAMYAALPQDEWWDFPIPDKIKSGRSLRGLWGALQWFSNDW